MADEVNFLAACAVGATFRTRDRREATIVHIDREAGLIHGDVTLFGPCRWRASGVYADAPGGAAGPLDLLPPKAGPAPAQRHVLVADHLTGEGRRFCCD